MNYPECKFYTKYGRCNHKDAPEPYHSQCVGKEQCLAWNDPITEQVLNPDSPIQKAAQEMYEALQDIIKEASRTHLAIGADLADSINVFGKQALAKAEGVE